MLLLASGTVVKVKVEPPFAVEKAVTALVALTAKSVATPVVGLRTLDTVTVQAIDVPTRRGLLVVQLKSDIVVGTPYTANTGDPFVMGSSPAVTEIENEALTEEGVTENVKEAPPFDVDGVRLPRAVAVRLKSLATPVVAPEAPETNIVQPMGLKIR